MAKSRVSSDGGPINLGENEYVDACMRLANWKEGEQPKVANRAYGEICTNTAAGGALFQQIGNPSSTSGYPRVIRLGGGRPDPVGSAVLELRERLQRALDEFLTKRRREDRTQLRIRANKAIAALNHPNGVRTELRIADDDRLEHIHTYFPGGGEGAEGLLLAFLLSPGHPFGSELAKCVLDTCQKFFLATKNPKGGPRRRYCSEVCQLEADAARAGERVARKRRRDAAAAAAKHK